MYVVSYEWRNTPYPITVYVAAASASEAVHMVLNKFDPDGEMLVTDVTIAETGTVIIPRKEPLWDDGL